MNDSRFFKVKTFLNLFIAFCLTAAIGCKKAGWFDIKSDKNLTVPSTMQDFELLLDNFELMSCGTPGLGEVGSVGHYLPDATWNTFPSHAIVNSQHNAYTWTNNFLYEQVQDWNRSYERLFHCNLVLEGIKKIKPTNPTEQEKFNQIKGNALFHRAKNYFELAQIYAPPYDPNTAATDLGLPLKSGTDVTESAVRSTVQETYAQIINDLNEASLILPNMPKLLTRGSKAACFALLSRVYLVMQDFSKAFTNANASLNIYNDLMNYNDIDASAGTLGLFNKETIFFSRMSNWLLVMFVYIDQDHYNLYADNDLRKTRFFRVDSEGIVFKGMYNENILPFTGLATDEMYLTRAECFARDGKVTEAMDDLNILLKNRWDNRVTFIPLTAIDANDALKLIFRERRKELFFRGIYWWDLKRLNREEGFQTTLTRFLRGKIYTIEPNSYRYTLPVPDDVMKLAPKMKQNPGWER